MASNHELRQECPGDHNTGPSGRQNSQKFTEKHWNTAGTLLAPELRATKWQQVRWCARAQRACNIEASFLSKVTA